MSLANLYANAGIVPAADDRLIKVIVPSRKLIWLWIPKNAGGSIARTLLKTHADAVACELPFDSIWRLNPELKTFKIKAIKRNPYTRAVSCWINKVLAVGAASEGFFRRYPGLIQEMPFPDFAAWLNSEEGGDANADPHWKSQHLLTSRVDQLLAFEDLPAPAQVLGIDPAILQHRNRHQETIRATGMPPRPLTKWYDAAARRNIQERYARDLEVLGYDFPHEFPRHGANPLPG